MYLIDIPETRYARSGDLDIAYQTIGEGERNIVVVMGLWNHLDYWHEVPGYTDFLRGLGRIGKVAYFDKRGFGLSDRWTGGIPTLEERMDDIGAVMDAAGMESAAVLAWSEGGPLAIAFATAHPERVTHLLLFEAFARMPSAPDYQAGIPREDWESMLDEIVANWGTAKGWGDINPRFKKDPELLALMKKGERVCLRRNEVRPAFEWMLDIDVRSLLHAISQPVLVMYRERGAYTAHGRYLAANIPGAASAAFDGELHSPWGEGDEPAILERVISFITGNYEDGIQSDRTLATVLFTDIVDSTTTALATGDRAWRTRLDRHDAIATETVGAFRGVLIKGTGDGILATFDGPGRAVRCARELVRRLAHDGLAVRAGLHTGEVERRGGDIAGVAVHLAARIAAEARGGEVLASRTVVDLTVGSDFGFENRGERVLKGFDRTWELFALRS